MKKGFSCRKKAVDEGQSLLAVNLVTETDSVCLLELKAGRKSRRAVLLDVELGHVVRRKTCRSPVPELLTRHDSLDQYQKPTVFFDVRYHSIDQGAVGR